jgi:hypothetical protein
MAAKGVVTCRKLFRAAPKSRRAGCRGISVRHVTDGPELHGFPPPGQLPELHWLGADYTSLLLHDLTSGLLRQDPGTRVIGVRCEGTPETAAKHDPSGVLRSYDACFALEIFVKDGRERTWRLTGKWTYVGRELGTPAAAVTHYWELFGAHDM